MLMLEVNDNGHGLNIGEADGGTGLDSMRLRAERLGGSFEVRSRENAGASVSLKVPIVTRSRIQTNHKRN